MVSHQNCLKQGDVLSPLLFNFALGYTIGRVQGEYEGLKLSGIQQLLVYADTGSWLSEEMRYAESQIFC